MALREAVGARVDEWLEIVEREIGYLMAEVQIAAEEDRARVTRTSHGGKGYAARPPAAGVAEDHVDNLKEHL